MALEDLKRIYDDKESKIVAETRHVGNIQAQKIVSDTIIEATSSLIRYIEGHISKAEVLNQIEGYATSVDISNIASKLDKLDKSIAGSQTDITPLLVGLNAVKEQIKEIPETKFEQKDHIKVDNLAEIKFDDVIKAINDKNLEVNVDAPVIHTEKTDTKLVESILSDIYKAVSKKQEAIKELKVSNLKDIKPTDTTKIETKLEKSNKYLKEISEKNFGGSSGGGRVSPYQDSNNIPSFVTLVNGKVPVDVDMATEGIATEATLVKTVGEYATKVTAPDANTTYVAIAPIGSAQASTVWQVKKILVSGNDTVITWADSNSNFDNVATDLTTLTYG